MKKLLCVFLVWCNASVLLAEEISAEYKEGIYDLNASFEVEASVEEIIGLLTDYENIAQLHPSIIESEILPTISENRSRIRTVVKDCVLLFCKEVVRVENVSQHSDHSIEAEVVPFLSDFRSGHTKWKVTQHGKTATVAYQSMMQPKFWIPPLIRSHTVTKKLKARIMEMAMRIQVTAPGYKHAEQ